MWVKYHLIVPSCLIGNYPFLSFGFPTVRHDRRLVGYYARSQGNTDRIISAQRFLSSLRSTPGLLFQGAPQAMMRCSYSTKLHTSIFQVLPECPTALKYSEGSRWDCILSKALEWWYQTNCWMPQQGLWSWCYQSSGSNIGQAWLEKLQLGT